MDCKEIMQTPTGNGQEQGSDMATDCSGSDTNRDITVVETSNTTSQSAELPREGNEDPKPVALIGELTDDGGLYGQKPAELPREGHEDSERETMIGRSPDDGVPYGLQSPLGEVEEKGLTTVVKTGVIENEAQYSSTGPTQAATITINTSPSATISVPEAINVPNELTHPHIEPPVSKEALAQLELGKIIYIPKFRYDINFREIQYGPSPDGERGRQKRQKADEFWHLLQLQISEYLSNPGAFQANHPGNTWTLPAILKAIGEILAALVPRADRSTIEEALNVNLLMQQFSRGVSDLEQLSQWLSWTLRTHCAPIRDTWVYEMVNQLTTGSRNGDIIMIVEGFRMLLGIVEAMRLVCTNHSTLWMELTGFRMLQIIKFAD